MLLVPQGQDRVCACDADGVAGDRALGQQCGDDAITLQNNAARRLFGATHVTRLNRRGNTVIEIEDNGHGVPDEITTKIFVPFFTTREGGSGVGLALARQLMIAHGGFVRPGQKHTAGTTLTLTF